MPKKSVLLFVLLLNLSRASSILAIELEAGQQRLEIHGFLSQGFLKSDHNNIYADTTAGTFRFNEFGVNFAADVTDRLRTGLQLFARDLGDISNNQVEIDWAYGDYRWKDWLGFRAGKMKAPYGFYNETRDVDMLRNSIFLPPSIYNEHFRDTYQAVLGVSLYGNLDLKLGGNLNYQIQRGEMHIAPGGGTARAIEDGSELELINSNTRDLFNCSVEWNTPLQGLRLGGSLITFNLDITFRTTPGTSWATTAGIPVGTTVAYQMHDTTIHTLSAEYVVGKLTLAAEYLRFHVDHIQFANVDATEDEEGYYGSIAYRLADWVELGAYYSAYYPDMHDRDGQALAAGGTPAYKAWQKEFVLTSRFDLNDHWTLKLESHFINGAALLLFQDNPAGLQENSFLLAVKTTYNF